MDDYSVPMSVDGEQHDQRVIIHIDIDCFYAQVEMLKNPALRSKPIGVQQKNCVVTSNYLAREFGIKKCMSVTEALKLCPKLVLVRGEDLHDYRLVSVKVSSLLQEFSILVERLGLDENYVDVTHLVLERLSQAGVSQVHGHTYGDPTECCECGCTQRLCVGSSLAQEIRTRIYDTLNITCCAGVAYNKLLAKLICSAHKPNQQTTLFHNGVPTFLSNLGSVRSLVGVGQRTAETLHSHGIMTIGDLSVTPLQRLEGVLGKDAALRLHKLSCGLDDMPVRRGGRPQSIGLEDGSHKITLESQVRDKFSHLLQKLMVLLAEDGRQPDSIRVVVRKQDKGPGQSHRETRQCSLPPSIFPSNIATVPPPRTSEKLLSCVMQLFHKMVDISQPFHLTLLGLAFTKLRGRHSGRGSLASFLVEDLSVQAITCMQSGGAGPRDPVQGCSTTSKDKPDSESEPEPEPKKTRMDKRKWLSHEDDESSPNKLRVSELRLNSPEKPPDPHDSIMWPCDVDRQVFSQLPPEVQSELMQSWKKQGTEIKQKRNTILHYFLPNK